MDIRIDDLTGAAVTRLLSEHLEHMRAITPEGSVYAHDLSRLRSPDVTFWTAWNGAELLGCAALKELDRESGEVKSMRTTQEWRRRGVAEALLGHLVEEALRRGYTDLYLETGATQKFEAARTLYAKHGFEACGPFGEYGDDAHSFFMRRRLT